MAISSQGLLQTLLFHDDKGDTISKRPRLICTTIEEVQTTLVKPVAWRHDHRAGIFLDTLKKARDLRTEGGAAESIGSLLEHPTRRHKEVLRVSMHMLKGRRVALIITI